MKEYLCHQPVDLSPIFKAPKGSATKIIKDIRYLSWLLYEELQRTREDKADLKELVEIRDRQLNKAEQRVMRLQDLLTHVLIQENELHD